MAQLNPESVERIVSFVREGQSDTVTISDAMALAELMARSFDGVFHAYGDSMQREFDGIAGAIAGMRHEIGRLQANDMTSVQIPTAGRELDAIVEATETATHSIMEAAEALMAADPDDGIDAFKDTVDQQCMTIFEACSFQDITGQRVSKVVETLKHIEDRIAHFRQSVGADDIDMPANADEVARQDRKRKLILHGPQLDGEGVGQSDVDALLSEGKEAGKGSSQNDIDALFK